MEILREASGKGWTTSPSRVQIFDVVAVLQDNGQWTQTPEPEPPFLLRVTPEQFMFDFIKTMRESGDVQNARLIQGGRLVISAAAAVMLLVTGSNTVSVDRLTASGLTAEGLVLTVFFGWEPITLLILREGLAWREGRAHVAAFDAEGAKIHAE